MPTDDAAFADIRPQSRSGRADQHRVRDRLRDDEPRRSRRGVHPRRAPRETRRRVRSAWPGSPGSTVSASSAATRPAEASVGGWPNGRRLGDDVVDIALTAVASGPTYATITVVGDNINANDQVYNQVFPYSATPHAGPTNRKDPGT